MVWALVSVVGFVFVTGLVIVMARSNTARWERDHRAPQAAARAHGAAMRSAWATTLSRWQHEQEPGDRLARRVPLHLPAGLVARLPHPHLPVHLPRPHLPRRSRPAPRADAGEDARS
jgi:hypothetical protein